MGSTSYDEARDPNDATWSGASWYGPSTGEYWIVNPREYADPRKHGPEYQSRARRLAAEGAAAEQAPDLEFADGGEGPAANTSGTNDTWSSPLGSAGARRTRAGWAASDARADTTADTTADATAAPLPGKHRPARSPGEALRDDPSIDPIERASRAWLGTPADDPVRRLGLALVAWPPLGLAAAAAIGEVTGCARFAAECGGSEPMLPWLAQALILGLLLLLPPVARLLAGGSIAVLIALVPVKAFLVAIGGSGAEAAQAGLALAVFLGVAWLMGVVWAARTLWFRPRSGAGSFT
jgi:hypothetical protein